MGSFILSTILTVPQTAASLVNLYDYFKPTDEPGDKQARRNRLDGLERRCTEGEERARAGIASEHQRKTALLQISRVRKLIAEGRSGKLLNIEPVELVCDVVEDGIHEALQQYASATPRPQRNEDELAKIKDKMIKDSPLLSNYSHIYSNTDTPPGIDFDNVGASPLVMLADQQCFMEYFAFGTDDPRTKSRICWMMLLLTELKSPRLVQPVKVFAVSSVSQPGFYTFSRVPSHLQGSVGPIHTLDEWVSRVRDKKKVLVQLSQAVEDIHAHTILHKSICAQNVLLDELDNTWLAGFSSSRLGDQDSYKIPQEEQVRMKMVYYASNEPSNYVRNFKCDIYALGVTMLEVAVGRSFVHNTQLIKSRSDIFRLLHDHCKACPLKQLISKCVAPEARSRPYATQIRSDLEFMDAHDIHDFFNNNINIASSSSSNNV